jgi:hypothetical protein
MNTKHYLVKFDNGVCTSASLPASTTMQEAGLVLAQRGYGGKCTACVVQAATKTANKVFKSWQTHLVTVSLHMVTAKEGSRTRTLVCNTAIPCWRKPDAETALSIVAALKAMAATLEARACGIMAFEVGDPKVVALPRKAKK